MVVSLHTKQKTLNLQNYTQEVEEGNSGTLMHGVEDLTRLTDIPCSWTAKLNTSLQLGLQTQRTVNQKPRFHGETKDPERLMHIRLPAIKELQ